MFLRPNITYIRRGKVGLTADWFLAPGKQDRDKQDRDKQDRDKQDRDKQDRDKYDSSFANQGHRIVTQTDLG
jgi:hypothetical protein